MFTLTIKTDNAAFHDDEEDDAAVRAEVLLILRRVAEYLEDGREEGPCMDSNGNKVGSWRLQP